MYVFSAIIKTGYMEEMAETLRDDFIITSLTVASMPRREISTLSQAASTDSVQNLMAVQT